MSSYLTTEGYKIRWCQNLGDAFKALEASTDLIILDWMLPDGQGLDFLKDMRASDNQVPVIMLTAKAQLIDRVVGLESGANDYLTKPFEPRELLARIRVQMRSFEHRSPKSQRTKPIHFGPLRVDRDKREVKFREKVIELTKMEFDLISLLIESPERVYSREEILNKVWGFENYPTTRTVDTHVLQLRQKLSERLIETVRGIGYRFRPLEE